MRKNFKTFRKLLASYILCIFWPVRCRQHLNPGSSMVHHHFLHNIWIQLIDAWRQVEDAVAHLLIQEDSNVAKLQVAIHQGNRCFFVVQGYSQVDRDGGGAGTALRAIDDDDFPLGQLSTHPGKLAAWMTAFARSSSAIFPARRMAAVISSTAGGLVRKSRAPASIARRI